VTKKTASSFYQKQLEYLRDKDSRLQKAEQVKKLKELESFIQQRRITREAKDRVF